MRPAISSLLALLAASCARSQPAPCAAGKLSPLLGCFRTVEARSSLGIQPGSLLSFAEDEVAVFNDEDAWARMEVKWNPPGGPARLEGAYSGGGTLAIEQASPEQIRIWNGDQVLGIAERLRGADAAAAAAKLGALPSTAAMRERARACFRAFAELMPGDKSMGSLDSENLHSTASAHGAIEAARMALLRQCKPIPEPCALPAMGSREKAFIERLERRCTARGLAP